MDYRIVIDGEELELNQKTKIEVQRLIIDPSDLSSRGLTITNSLIIPFTNINDRLLGYPSRLASNNMAFENSIKYLLADSVGILSHGSIITKSFNDKKGIKIQLVEGFDFWTQAGKKKLNDLVNHEDDFIFINANMNALKTPSSSVFLTALMDAANSYDTALDSYKYTRPCIYFRSLLEKITNELGYTLDLSEVLYTTELLNIGCLSNTNEFYVSDFKRSIERLTVTGNIDLSIWSIDFIKVGNVSLLVDTLTNGLYKTSYVIKGWVTSLTGCQILFTFGSNIERIIVPAGRSFVSFRSDEVEVGTELVISTTSAITFEDTYIYSAIPESSIFEVALDIDIEDFLVLGDYNFPQMTYKDFIKIILQMFFLDFDIDEQKKTAKLRYLPNHLSTSNAVDLSNVVDRNFEVSSGNIYGQLNVLGYSNDEDITPNLGEAYFTVENKNASPSKEFLRISAFSASNEIQIDGENMVSVAIYNAIEMKRESVKDRIVYFNEVGSFGFNAIINKISWQRLFSEHYINFVENTKRERTTEITAYLNQLNFSKIVKSPIVYIDHMNAYFLITKISGYSRNNLCKLDAIKYN